MWYGYSPYSCKYILTDLQSMVQLKGNLTDAPGSQVEKLRVSLHYRVQMGAGDCSGCTRVLQPMYHAK